MLFFDQVDELLARMDAEFLIDVMDVRVDGGEGDVEILCDSPGGAAFRNKREHFELALRYPASLCEVLALSLEPRRVRRKGQARERCV